MVRNAKPDGAWNVLPRFCSFSSSLTKRCKALKQQRHVAMRYLSPGTTTELASLYNIILRLEWGCQPISGWSEEAASIGMRFRSAPAKLDWRLSFLSFVRFFCRTADFQIKPQSRKTKRMKWGSNIFIPSSPESSSASLFPLLASLLTVRLFLREARNQLAHQKRSMCFDLI